MSRSGQWLSRWTQSRLLWLRRMLAAWLERAQMSEHLFDIGVAMVIGILCGFSVVGFRYLIHAFQLLFWGEASISLEQISRLGWWRRVIAPAVGGLLVGPIVYFMAREARGHGVPEVMRAIALKKGVIRGRVALAKALASAMTISSGGSAGREGPVIQIGSALGSWLGQLLRVSGGRMRTFVGCGAAAGIAATFNAPIAGALFAVEVILGQFGIAQFGPIVISSVLATVIARFYFAGGPVFQVEEYRLVSLYELGPYLILGLACGVVGAAFKRTLYWMEDLFQRQKSMPEWIQPMVGGLALGVLGCLVPHVYGDGYASINMALNSRMPALLLGVLLLAKLAATSLTLGSGGSGGVFAPSLFLGAMTGGVIGKLSGLLLGHSAGDPGGYALVGMGGLVAAATHGPISAILIIFEITYDYSIILPLMTVCIVGTVLSRALCRESIYTMKLARQGVDLYRGQPLDLLRAVPISACLRTDFESFPPETKARDLVQRMIASDKSQFYVTTAQDRFFGVVSLGDLRRILMHREGLEQILLAEDLAHERIPTCVPDDSLSHVVPRFEQSGLPELPVVKSHDDRTLIGVVRYQDVLARYSEEMIKVDSAEVVARQVQASQRQLVKLMEGYYLAEWDPPSSLWGKTLAQAALPAHYHVHVILVKKKNPDAKPGDADRVMPLTANRDYVITAQDALLIYGRERDVERALRL